MTKLKIHQRHLLKSKDIKALKITLIKQISEENVDRLLSKKNTIEWIKLSNREELIVINNTLCFWYHNERYIPLMSLLLDSNILYKIKSVTVDQGAIPYVTNGANIMRPGIIKIDSDIQKDDIVKIQDPKHGRALAVGIALFNAGEMEELKSGKVIKNIHTINDEIWAFSKEFS